MPVLLSVRFERTSPFWMQKDNGKKQETGARNKKQKHVR